MKAALLGPGGLIGSAVAAVLNARGHAIVGIGHGAATIKADLADVSAIALDWFAGCDALIHCAGVTDEEVKADVGQAAKRAFMATSALIENGRRAGVSRFIYVSSAHVYGQLVGHIDENTQPNPLSDYALLHFVAEQVFRRAATENDVLILRPCAVYGPLPDPARFRRWSLVPFSFPRDAAMLGEIKLASAGTQRRNFVSSQAVAEAAVDWLERPVKGITTANVLGNEDLSISALADRTAALCQSAIGRPCKVTRPQQGGAASPDTFAYRSNVEKPRPGLPLDQHLINILNAYRETGAVR